MAQSTVALIIMVLAIVAMVSGKVSISMSLMSACCLMALTGILSFSEAFSAFSSSTVWLLIALMVVGAAFQRCGLMELISENIMRLSGNNEKKFIAIMYVMAAISSWLVNGIIVLVVFMAVVDRMSEKEGSTITRKNLYYPIALGSAYGGLCSSVGSSAMMNVSSQLGESGFGRAFHLLETFPVGIAVTITGLLFYLTIGYPLQKKVFNYPDILPEKHEWKKGKEPDRKDKIHLAVTAVVLAATIIIVALELINTGIVSVAAILILVLTGCISEKEMYRSIDWHVVFCVVGALGFGKGIAASGAGEIIANAILNHCGPLANSAFGMCILCLIIAIILSNFMANNSAAAIITPISFGIAEVMGQSLLPFAISCAIGVNMAIMTPVSRTTVTMTLGAGYNFRHLAIVGGVLTVITTAVAAAAIKIMYF